MLSSAKIGRSSWRYYQRTVAGGACEYYIEHGDRPGRWYGSGLSALGLSPGAMVEERELEALFGRALSPTTGKQLGAAWREDAVTGFDLTFSASKSVSAWWALADADTAAAIDTVRTALRSTPRLPTSKSMRRCRAVAATASSRSARPDSPARCSTTRPRVPGTRSCTPTPWW